MGKIQDLYNTSVRPMSPAERLQLAKLILDHLAPEGGDGADNAIDVSDEWADDDLAEVAAYSARHANGLPPPAPRSPDEGGRSRP